MSVPAIALYATPPGALCSSPHYPLDYDMNPNPNSRPALSSSPSPPSSSGQKHIAGGLSCLFARPSSAAFSGADELGSLWHDRSDDLSGSFSYPSSFKCRDPSPVSALQFPVSASSRTLPPRISMDWGKDRIFSGFVRHALSSCLDYDQRTLEAEEGSEELTFDLDEGSERDNDCDPYARDLISKAQSRNQIFHEEVVVKAFYEAEKAHRGQMRASGDPYLLHCLETAELLSKIGANTTVVAAGLLHDTYAR